MSVPDITDAHTRRHVSTAHRRAAHARHQHRTSRSSCYMVEERERERERDREGEREKEREKERDREREGRRLPEGSSRCCRSGSISLSPAAVLRISITYQCIRIP
eukprot:2958469-Rhodomonas_salina.2